MQVNILPQKTKSASLCDTKTSQTRGGIFIFNSGFYIHKLVRILRMSEISESMFCGKEIHNLSTCSMNMQLLLALNHLLLVPGEGLTPPVAQSYHACLA